MLICTQKKFWSCFWRRDFSILFQNFREIITSWNIIYRFFSIDFTEKYHINKHQYFNFKILVHHFPKKKTEFVSQTLSSSQISNDHLWRNRHICTCHPHTTDVFREESQKRLSLHFFLYSLLQRLLYCRRNSRDLNCFYSVIFPLDKWLMLTGML